MVQFTKKLIDFGGSKAIIVPREIVELYGLHRGDFVTLDVKGVEKNDRTL